MNHKLSLYNTLVTNNIQLIYARQWNLHTPHGEISIFTLFLLISAVICKLCVL